MAKIFTLLLFFVLVYNYIPKSELRDDDSMFLFLSKYYPQGWGYFTRNPLENQYEFYNIKNNKVNKINFNNSNLSENLFGIARNQRMINYEYTFLLTRCKEKINWSYNTELNYDSVIKKNKIINVNYNKKLNFINNNDTIVVVLQKILPFKWEMYQNKNQIPNLMAILVFNNETNIK